LGATPQPKLFPPWHCVQSISKRVACFVRVCGCLWREGSSADGWKLVRSRACSWRPPRCAHRRRHRFYSTYIEPQSTPHATLYGPIVRSVHPGMSLYCRSLNFSPQSSSANTPPAARPHHFSDFISTTATEAATDAGECSVVVPPQPAPVFRNLL